MRLPIDVPFDELVRLRRHFHANPELSLLEVDTSAFLLTHLQAMEFDDLRTGVAGTGILATLKGGRPGPVTLLRADMDALPIAEQTGASYASRREHVMHACGHDGHMSILLEAARTLAGRRADIAGTLVFCFQPAEEGPAGNRLMIEAGALENPHVERTFALHLSSSLDVGRIGVRDGAFFASADRFHVRLRGRGGHGAIPDQAIDPIAGGAQLVSSLQHLISREISPKHPAVMTIGRFTSGDTFNVIPEDAVLEGTVRCFDTHVRVEMPQKIERIIAGVCAAHRLTYTFEYVWQYPPTVNDANVNALVRQVGADVVGADHVVEYDLVMWAEDMAFMQEQRPGAYFLVGSRGGEKTAYAHHSPYFDIDEDALGVGYAMMVSLGLS